jgi:hypothetical protein
MAFCDGIHRGTSIDGIDLDVLGREPVIGGAFQEQIRGPRVMNPRVREGWLLAAVTTIARTKPSEQVRTWRLIPLIFLLPSPRSGLWPA